MKPKQSAARLSTEQTTNPKSRSSQRLNTGISRLRWLAATGIAVLALLTLGSCNLPSIAKPTPTVKIIYITQTPEVIVITNTPDITKTMAMTQIAKALTTLTPIVKEESCDQLIREETPQFANSECEYFGFRKAWTTRSERSEVYNARSDVKNGVLELNVEVAAAPPGYTGGYYGDIEYQTATRFNTQQFFVSALLNIPKSDYYSASGLSFGDDDQKYFYLLDPMNQNYNILKYDQQNGYWVEVSGWRYSDQIVKNGPNHIAILFTDGIAALYANGSIIREEPLPSQISDGYIGLSSYVPYGRTSNMVYDDLLLMYP